MIRPLTLSAALLLGACAGMPSIGSAHYPLPPGSLGHVEAKVVIVPRAEMAVRAKAAGAKVAPYMSVHGFAEYDLTTKVCTITLAADKDGYAALEHELWHCKLGKWHP